MSNRQNLLQLRPWSRKRNSTRRQRARRPLLLVVGAALLPFAVAAAGDVTQEELAGNWSGSFGGDPLNFSVNSSGNLSGTAASGYAITGNLNPNGSGTLTYTGASTFNLNLTYTQAGANISASGPGIGVSGPDTGLSFPFSASGGGGGSPPPMPPEPDPTEPLVDWWITPENTRVLLGDQVLFMVFGQTASGIVRHLAVDAWQVTGGGEIQHGGIFTATEVGGPFSVTAGVGHEAYTATIRVDANEAPSITSKPTVFPHTIAALAPARFEVAAEDPEGRPLVYRWDFGDGSEGFGTNPIHVYATAGSYTVTVTVNDWFQETAETVRVTVLAGGIQTPTMDVRSFRARIRSGSDSRDVARIKGYIRPLAADALAGKKLDLLVGGLRVSFNLDKRGKAKTELGTFALRVKNGVGLFKANIRNADLFNTFEALGLNMTSGSQSLTVPFSVFLPDASFRVDKDVLFRANARGGVLR